HKMYIEGINYCSICREAIKKYPEFSEYFNRHIIERIIRNRIYTGVVEYAGVGYKLLDNIVDDELIKKLNDRSKYIKSIKTMRYYKYYYKIYYMGSRMYPTTSIKRYKDKVKEYPYYRDKSKNVYIAESKLDKILEGGLKQQNSVNVDKVNGKLDNLKKMFAMGDIDEEQYTETKKEIKNSKVNLEGVQRIEIDEHFNIKVIFVNGQNCSVGYNRGRW
ncbi:MAG: SHOCT domain-containing protein, partial [Mycoplasmatales bacterium]